MWASEDSAPWWPAAAVSAMRFHAAQIGGVQHRTIRVWAYLRWGPVAEPRSLTSSIAARYLALVSAGGAGGRNWSALRSRNGFTRGQWVNTGWPKAGGVSWYSPGPVPGVNGVGAALEPSLSRARRI